LALRSNGTGPRYVGRYVPTRFALPGVSNDAPATVVSARRQIATYLFRYEAVPPDAPPERKKERERERFAATMLDKLASSRIPRAHPRAHPRA